MVFPTMKKAGFFDLNLNFFVNSSFGRRIWEVLVAGFDYSWSQDFTTLGRREIGTFPVAGFGHSWSQDLGTLGRSISPPGRRISPLGRRISPLVAGFRRLFWSQ